MDQQDLLDSSVLLSLVVVEISSIGKYARSLQGSSGIVWLRRSGELVTHGKGRKIE